jgi:plastocyanin
MRRGRGIVAVALTVVALVVLGGCGGDDDGGGTKTASAKSSEPGFTVSGDPVATDKVTLPQSYKFEPAVISVKTGSTVTWENKDNFPHNVKVFKLGKTVDLSVGKSASITFDEAGTFLYQCTLHPAQMKGKVIVED